MAEPRPIESHEAFIGMLVTWMHVPRGGYGFAVPVPGRITKLNLQGDSAEIEVQTAAGATVRRRVRTRNLRHRREARHG